MKTFLLVIVLGLVCSHTFAANADDAATRAQAKLQGMLREISADRDRLKQQVASLTLENQQLKADSAVQKQSAETANRLNGELVALKSSQQRLNDQFDQTRQRLQEISEKYKGLQQEMQRLNSDLRQSQTSKSALDDEFEQCLKKNLSLLHDSRELMDSLGQRSVFDDILAQEPLFGLNAVELENQIQNYQEKLEAHRFKPDQSLSTETTNSNTNAESGGAQ